jgi:hypothetical protein
MRLQSTYHNEHHYAILGGVMLGYTKEDLDNMVYGIKTADFMLDADQNPAIHNYLVMASDFLSGLWAEGYFD